MICEQLLGIPKTFIVKSPQSSNPFLTLFPSDYHRLFYCHRHLCIIPTLLFTSFLISALVIAAKNNLANLQCLVLVSHLKLANKSASNEKRSERRKHHRG